MKPEFLLTAASLLISGFLAALQIKSWLQDQDSKEKQKILSMAHADQDRDGIIVGSAERAVGILEATLNRVSREADELSRRLQATQNELEKTQDALSYARAEIEDLRAEVQALRQENASKTQHPGEGVGP